ncbi:MAG TPA: ABC transporter ATP-binding protein [Rhizomicrobium sp.]|jgi:ABC-type multidrug transport system ATPase subunit|nr:ABC transporter ATP-binding protein [Rhizomicrobium sp.]
MIPDGLLRFDGLAASYGRHRIFRSASLALAAGVYALKGPNGIGKSTLLRLLAGAQPADAGEVWIDGISVMRASEEAKRHLSYVPDESPIYPFMTGNELLQFVASIKRTRIDGNVQALIAEFELSAQLDTRFDSLSSGTQKKMMLCAAWIGAPRVLLLDEPSNGLDEAARAALARLLGKWARHGTVLFAAHDADFVATTEASVIAMQDICETGDTGR